MILVRGRIPVDVTNKGDVKNRLHVNTTPIIEVFSTWDGETESAKILVALEKYRSPKPVEIRP